MIVRIWYLINTHSKNYSNHSCVGVNMLQSTIAVLFFLFVSSARCSLPPALAAPVPISYQRIAPPNIVPFAASVSTFTKGLNIYAAHMQQPVPGVVAAPNPAVAVPNGILPSPLLPPPFRVPQNYIPRINGVPGVLGSPAVVPGVVSPSSLLPAPFGLPGRSVHGFEPAVPIRPAVVG
ncbi:hypothetical protein WA026_013136 [Henosepilachna vigintioctopunctata]|uniref:Uncharacterized protein n=1 Tax=Henosepilachna vigintioctopunctata TaxID=420089 RepID=A0AAW1UDS1_9CUCU